MTDHRKCELCGQAATIYCASDSAFLCFNCDSRVHGANFLAARHLRQPLCSTCKPPSEYNNNNIPISGDVLCTYCSPEKKNIYSFSGGHHDKDDTLSSSSSACVSSTESTKLSLRKPATSVSGKKPYGPARSTRTSADYKAEGIFVNWCKKLELSSGRSSVVVTSALNALGFCVTWFPLRVALATSFWFGVRMIRSGNDQGIVSTCKILRRVEKITGVGVKVILTVDGKMRREMMRVRRRKREMQRSADEKGIMDISIEQTKCGLRS